MALVGGDEIMGAMRMKEGKVDLSNHPSISWDDLARLDEPSVILEGWHRDSDGVRAYFFTVAGYLDGRQIAVPHHARRAVLGCKVNGDAMIVHAESAAAAKAMAADGLFDTIEFVRAEQAQRAAEEAEQRRREAADPVIGAEGGGMLAAIEAGIKRPH